MNKRRQLIKSYKAHFGIQDIPFRKLGHGDKAMIEWAESFVNDCDHDATPLTEDNKHYCAICGDLVELPTPTADALQTAIKEHLDALKMSKTVLKAKYYKKGFIHCYNWIIEQKEQKKPKTKLKLVHRFPAGFFE